MAAAGVGAISIPLWCSSPSTTTKTSSFMFKLRFLGPVNFCIKQSSPFNGRRSHNLDTLPFFHNHITPRAASSSSSVESAEYIEEPATKVKFPTSITLPGSSTSLALLGTGYREKVFAIIGVKVYAAGLYVDQSIFLQLQAWRGRAATEVQQDGGLFDTIFQAPSGKSLQIVLVRDVDGKTFWDALDEAITPRMSSPTTDDKSALSTFRSIFQGRALKKQTFIFLTWINPTKMLVSVSSDGLPSSVDATIESVNVTSALFNVFLGDGPVSPSLKISVAEGLSTALMQKA